MHSSLKAALLELARRRARAEAIRTIVLSRHQLADRGPWSSRGAVHRLVADELLEPLGNELAVEIREALREIGVLPVKRNGSCRYRRLVERGSAPAATSGDGPSDAASDPSERV